MPEPLILLALLLAIVVVGSLAVLIYDAIELMLRERRVRLDVKRGPWGPR